MRLAELRGKAARRWKKTTIPDPAAAARADAIRQDFTADAARINQRWRRDITYIATWLPSSTSPSAASSGSPWLIICAPSWSPVRWATRSSPGTRAGVNLHSDRGCQPPLRRPGRRLPSHLAGRAHRAVPLGQCPGGELLLLPQRRAHRNPGMAYPGRSLPCDRGVIAWYNGTGCTAPPATALPLNSRTTTMKAQARSLTELTSLSIKAGQPQDETGSVAQRTCSVHWGGVQISV